MKNCLLLLFFSLFASACFAQNFDIDLLRKINVGRNKNFDNAFVAISNSATPISILTPMAILCEGFSKKDSNTFNKGVVIGASFVISTGITFGLKYSMKRPRPFTTYSFIEKVSDAGSPSFPSGHTSEAFSTATSLSLAFPKWYVIAPSFLWAGAVGYSRMDLGVHYPSDVLAGAIIGAGSAFLCTKANRLLHKFK